jgi:hypothetical protein
MREKKEVKKNIIKIMTKFRDRKCSTSCCDCGFSGVCAVICGLVDELDDIKTTEKGVKNEI